MLFLYQRGIENIFNRIKYFLFITTAMNGRWKTSVATAWVPFRRLKHMQKYDFLNSLKSSAFSYLFIIML